MPQSKKLLKEKKKTGKKMISRKLRPIDDWSQDRCIKKSTNNSEKFPTVMSKSTEDQFSLKITKMHCLKKLLSRERSH